MQTNVETDNKSDDWDEGPEDVVVPVHVIPINNESTAEERDDHDEHDVDYQQRDEQNDEEEEDYRHEQT